MDAHGEDAGVSVCAAGREDGEIGDLPSILINVEGPICVQMRRLSVSAVAADAKLRSGQTTGSQDAQSNPESRLKKRVSRTGTAQLTNNAGSWAKKTKEYSLF